MKFDGIEWDTKNASEYGIEDRETSSQSFRNDSPAKTSTKYTFEKAVTHTSQFSRKKGLSFKVTTESKGMSQILS